MPMFHSPIAAPVSAVTPLRANLDDMVHATLSLEGQLKYIVEDGETFGGLSEDTFLDNAPEMIKMLERISLLVRISTRDLAIQESEDAMDVEESGALGVVLYNFLSQHRRAIDTITAQHKTLRFTGSLYNSVGRCLTKERVAMGQFRTALEARYFDLRGQTEADWRAFNESIGAATSIYPAPVVL